MCGYLWGTKQNRDYIKPRRTVQNWQWVIRGFDENCQFPNCVAAIDRKHICIPRPPSSGFLYFNNKKTFSIILLAGNDANYFFTLTLSARCSRWCRSDRTRPHRKQRRTNQPACQTMLKWDQAPGVCSWQSMPPHLEKPSWNRMEVAACRAITASSITDVHHKLNSSYFIGQLWGLWVCLLDKMQ